MGVINRDDVPVAIKDDNVELRLSQAGDLSVSFVQLRGGTDLEPALAGLPGNLCELDKQGAAPTWKKTFGFHSLLCFLDRPDVAGRRSPRWAAAVRECWLEHRC